jgi:hypothetical protein
MYTFKIQHNHSGMVTRGNGVDAYNALIARHPKLAGRVSKVTGQGFTFASRIDLASFTLSLALGGRSKGKVKAIRPLRRDHWGKLIVDNVPRPVILRG